MTQRTLFRTEALSYQTSKVYGSVFINVPVIYSVITFVALLLFFGFLLFIIVTNYTEHYLVKGFLNTKAGMIHVYPLRTGVIRKQYVVIGQHVKKGDLLYIIDSSYADFSVKKSLEHQQIKARLVAIQHHIAQQQKRLDLIKPLLKKHYISLSTFHALEDDLSKLETNRQELIMEWIHYKSSKHELIRAPISGEISSIEYRTGEVSTPSKALLSMLPSHSDLIAQLYIPVSKAGFIHKDALVSIQYDAYPYQHFGVASGHIIHITRSVLSDKDENKPITIGEPYYKATVSLDQQTIPLYGRQHRLQQGLTCSAMIEGMHQKIWRWMLDPTGLTSPRSTSEHKQ